MIQTVEAVIDEQGIVRLLELIRLPGARRALVTILEESPTLSPSATSLVREWNTTHNDMATLLRETAAWEAASENDALKIEERLAKTD